VVYFSFWKVKDILKQEIGAIGIFEPSVFNNKNQIVNDK
jgi:hypothetical protein